MMKIWMYLSAVVTTAIILIIFTKSALGKYILDKPNERSLHTKVVPRTGGVAIISGISASFFYELNHPLWMVLVIGLALVSFLDDWLNLPVHFRLFFHILAAYLFVANYVTLHYCYAIIFILILVWMTNLYNFMDGSDGLSAGMAVFGFLTYAIVLYGAGELEVTRLCILLGLTCMIFLCFNFHPASIFMGDAGSVPIGFLAGSIGLYGYTHHFWSWWFPVMVFSPFIIDSTVTLIKRACNMEKIWRAHRSHYYQRLIQMGWGHKKTALAEYCLMMLSSGLAIYLLKMPQKIILISLILFGLTYCLLMFVIDKKWQHFRQITISVD